MCDHTQDKEKLRKKAKRKWLITPVIKGLVGLNSPFKSKYYTTFYCCSSIKTHEGKTSSRYCKRPWCNVCNSIKMAVRINAYGAELMAILNLQLTTLTLPNCTGETIRESCQRFRKIFRQFRNTYEKQTGRKFRGVDNLESTIKLMEEKKRFHPHVHIIHEPLPFRMITGKTWKAKIYNGYSEGTNIKWVNSLMEYWLKKNPQCTLAGQDMRACTDLIEGFKYTNKSIYNTKLNGKNETVIPLHDLDTLYQSIAGLRMFQAYGLTKVIENEEEEFEKLSGYTIEDKPDGIYKWASFDWYHKVENTPLSDFIPNEKENLYYATLNENKHYRKKTKTTTPVHQLKRIRQLPENSGQAEHPSALQRILDKRRQESSIPQADKPRHSEN